MTTSVSTFSSLREDLIDRFQPLFDRIAEGTIRRERERILPREQVRWLSEAGFTAITVPALHGGIGASPTDLFALLIRLGEADSNLPQLLRAHFSFVEGLVLDPVGQDVWFSRVLAGQVFGNASHERSGAEVGSLVTKIRPDGGGNGSRDGWRLDGEKAYSTGTLFADWTSVTAEDPDGNVVGVTVPVGADGVEVVDDWNGFGQRLTGTGTTRFVDVRVDPENVRDEHDSGRPTLLPSFLQTILLSALAGVARATSRDAADFVRSRTRVYSQGVGATAAADPLVQSIVGRISADAVAAEALVLDAAAAIERAHSAVVEGAREDDVDTLVAAAELRTVQAQLTVVELTLRSTTALFEVGGASATDRDRALDRHWRNARTIASHNPVVFQQRLIGDHIVNGSPLQYFWATGESRSTARP